LDGGFRLGGASLSQLAILRASAWIPGSSSLIHTPAAMCIAATSTIPSSTPDSRNRVCDIVRDPHELAALWRS
jgi:hypothetical protein